MSAKGKTKMRLQGSIRACFWAALCLTIFVGGAGAQSFFSALPDLPLMPGLTETPEAGMRFDTAKGRIVESFATGQGSVAEAVRFYAETLPQLGWTATGPGDFAREDEVLRIEAVENSQGLTLRFAIAPRN
jgi:hypothetical protein